MDKGVVRARVEGRTERCVVTFELVSHRGQRFSSRARDSSPAARSRWRRGTWTSSTPSRSACCRTVSCRAGPESPRALPGEGPRLPSQDRVRVGRARVPARVKARSSARQSPIAELVSAERTPPPPARRTPRPRRTRRSSRGPAQPATNSLPLTEYEQGQYTGQQPPQRLWYVGPQETTERGLPSLLQFHLRR